MSTMGTSSATRRIHRTATNSARRTSHRRALTDMMATNSATRRIRRTATIDSRATNCARRTTRTMAMSSATTKTRTMGIESCFETASAASMTAMNSEFPPCCPMEKTRVPTTALPAGTGSAA